MNVNWLRIGAGVLSGIFIAFILYGAYRFYFDKPVPIVNNQTFAPDSKPVINQAVPKNGNNMLGIVAVPVYLGGEWGGFIGLGGKLSF